MKRIKKYKKIKNKLNSIDHLLFALWDMLIQEKLKYQII